MYARNTTKSVWRVINKVWCRTYFLYAGVVTAGKQGNCITQVQKSFICSINKGTHTQTQTCTYIYKSPALEDMTSF